MLMAHHVEGGATHIPVRPHDRIALTDEGRRIARGMRGERREMLTGALAAFTDEERTELARLLNKLADNWQR